MRTNRFGLHGFRSLDTTREAFLSVCNLSLTLEFFRRLPVSANSHRTTIEESATLDGKRLVVNIANHMSLRFQKDLSFPNWTVDFSIYHDSLGGSYRLHAPGVR